MNIETGEVITSQTLGTFAADLISSQLRLGAVKGQYGWDNGNEETPKEIKRRLDAAFYSQDHAKIVLYAAMLAARNYNSLGEEVPHDGT